MSPVPPPVPRPVRRRALYVAGFDPRGPRHYFDLFADAARRWGGREGAHVEVGPRSRLAPHVMARTVRVERPDRPPVECQLEFLRWDDHVRAQWPRPLAKGGWRDLAGMMWAAWHLIATGSFAHHYRRAWPAALGAVGPAVKLVATLLAVMLTALAFVATLAGGGWGWWLAPLPFALLAVWLSRYGGRGTVDWAGATMLHEVRNGWRDLMADTGRRAELAAHVRAALDDPAADEVIVVGHSIGARVAASLMADAIRAAPTLCGGDRLRLLTLGHSITYIAVGRGGGDWLRDDLAVLADCAGLEWIDVTSPPDGVNAALMDPVREALGREGGPRTFNARFHVLHSPERYAALRGDRHGLHFLFFGVPDRPDPRELDLWDMLLSPAPALARFDRPSHPGPFYAPEHRAARRRARRATAPA